MIVGFEMLFSRDLICKYLNEDFLRKKREELELVWQVIGTYDFVKVATLENLEGLIEVENPNGDGTDRLNARLRRQLSDIVGEVAHSGLVLFPPRDRLAESTEHQNEAFEAFMRSLKSGPEFSENAVECPVLVGARIILSPVAYELAPLYSCVLDAIDALVTITRNKAVECGITDERRFQVFRSLSSPDLVILGLPCGPDDLSKFDQLFQRLRLLRLHQLRKTMVEGMKPGKATTFQHPEDAPGHALSALDEMLAFRVNSEKGFSWKEDLTQFTPPVDIGLRVEVGHEEWVRGWRDKQTPSGKKLTIDFLNDVKVGPLHTWDRHPLRGRISSLTAFVDNWRVLFTEHNLRQANLVDTHAVISFPRTVEVELEDQHPTAVWELRSKMNSPAPVAPEVSASKLPHSNPMIASEVTAVPTSGAEPETAVQDLEPVAERIEIAADPLIWDELCEIRAGLRTWSDQFLSESQRQEFMNSIRTFQNCFLHHELASAARDLVPFFRQLSFACHLNMFCYWHAYRDEVDVEVFANEVSVLIGHLHQAVRNRLEHRSKSTDPTNPHSLEHGACKLVNAYSAMYWFVSQLFWDETTIPAEDSSSSKSPPPQPSRDDKYCDAARLAVAVASGNQGRISCREIFAGFRKFVEERASSRPHPKPPSKGDSADTDLPHRLRITDREQDICQWSARLLLLEVSGKALFRPEICLVHCCHEVAELSDWLTTPRTVLLRRRLNAWILGYYTNLLSKLVCAEIDPIPVPTPQASLVQWLTGSQPAQDGMPLAEPQPMQVNMNSLMIKKLGEFLNDHILSILFETKALGHWYLENEHPVEFCRLVASRMATHLSDVDKWQAQSWPSNTPLLFPEVRQVVMSPEFRRKALQMTRIVQEMSADIGMWCALDHLASKGHFVQRTPEKRTLDVHRTFSNVVQAHVERCADKITSEEAQLFLLRWAVQAAAVADGGDWQKDLRLWISAEIASTRAKHLELLVQHLQNDSDQNTLEKVLVNLVRDYSLILPQVASRDEKIPFAILVDELRRSETKDSGGKEHLAYYHTGPREEYTIENTFRFPFCRPADLTAAERSLWNQFSQTWNQPGQHASSLASPTLARAQIELVFHMWAKACRLRYKQAFKLVTEA